MTVFDNSDKDFNFGRIEDELALETVANQAFFEENILSYSIYGFDSDSNSNSNENDFTKPVSQNEDDTL